jgi:hypothetical protein
MRARRVRYVAMAGAAVALFILFESASRLGAPLTGPLRVLSWVAAGYAPFLMVALIGTFLIGCMTRPSRRELGERLLLGAVIAALLMGARLARGHAPLWPDALGVGLGTATLLSMAALVLRTRGQQRVEAQVLLLGAGMLPAFVLYTTPFLELTLLMHPTTLDGVVYAADSTLGWQPAFVLGRLLQARPPLELAINIVYAALPFALALVIGLQMRGRCGRAEPDAVALFLLAGVAAFSLYHVVPVTGPLYAFEGVWPWTEPLAAAVAAPMAVPEAARNCIPSMHTTWALLIFFNTRGYHRAIRVGAALFLALTLLATLGLGYHYLMDLVVAVPYTVALQAAMTPGAGARAVRGAVVALSAAMTLGWLLMLRFAVPWMMSWPLVQWSLVLATVTLSLWLERLATGAAVRTATGPQTAEAELAPAGGG